MGREVEAARQAGGGSWTGEGWYLKRGGGRRGGQASRGSLGWSTRRGRSGSTPRRAQGLAIHISIHHPSSTDLSIHHHHHHHARPACLGPGPPRNRPGGVAQDAQDAVNALDRVHRRCGAHCPCAAPRLSPAAPQLRNRVLTPESTPAPADYTSNARHRLHATRHRVQLAAPPSSALPAALASLRSPPEDPACCGIVHVRPQRPPRPPTRSPTPEDTCSARQSGWVVVVGSWHRLRWTACLAVTPRRRMRGVKGAAACSCGRL